MVPDAGATEEIVGAIAVKVNGPGEVAEPRAW